MKVLALYLPQFHRVKENDEWWGEGFTEWIAVKNAKPLYESHKQPVIPLDNNYYNLLDYKTMKNQEALIKECGIDGFCIYHYWFENGRRILEKPAENLLKWKDIDINYCFSWANETWARSWSNLTNANVWSLQQEMANSTKSNGILLKQRYGNQSEWKNHFDYLLNFFRDKRYIKVDNKPVICIYNVKDIYCFENMIDYWQELAVQNGFDGIFVIGKNVKDSQMVCVNEKLISEPADAINNSIPYKQGNIDCYDYDEIWEKILNTNFKEATVGGFVGYDDTPRRGEKGIVIEGKNPQKFKAYFYKLIEKNKENNREFCILNAWNEWGEGMYLEPDVFDGYGYLSAVKDCLSGNVKTDACDNEIDESNVDFAVSSSYIDLFEREKERATVLDAWLKISEEGLSIADVYAPLKGKKVAVYGYGILGKHLVAELKKSDIDLGFIIDRKCQYCENLDVYKPEEDWPDVDLIIVTPTYDYGSVYKMIKLKNDKIMVVSLAHIVMDYL